MTKRRYYIVFYILSCLFSTCLLYGKTVPHINDARNAFFANDWERVAVRLLFKITLKIQFLISSQFSLYDYANGYYYSKANKHRQVNSGSNSNDRNHAGVKRLT